MIKDDERPPPNTVEYSTVQYKSGEQRQRRGPIFFGRIVVCLVIFMALLLLLFMAPPVPEMPLVVLVLVVVVVVASTTKVPRSWRVLPRPASNTTMSRWRTTTMATRIPCRRCRRRRRLYVVDDDVDVDG